MGKIIGPASNTQEWYDARLEHIGASESAAAIGVHNQLQPLDVYLEKTGAIPPFEGNEYTARGLRFQPFAGQEYELAFGVELVGDQPMYIHGERQHISATPDFIVRDDPTHLVETKVLHWSKAGQLGPQGSDEIPVPWLAQVQQQMYVLGASVCDLWVMLGLHDWRVFTVEANQEFQNEMARRETELWHLVEIGEPPAPDFHMDGVRDLVHVLFDEVKPGEAVALDGSTANKWQRCRELSQQISSMKRERDKLQAEVEFVMQNAERGMLPGSGRELVRSYVPARVWDHKDVEAARARVGDVQRAAYFKLHERHVR